MAKLAGRAGVLTVIEPVTTERTQLIGVWSFSSAYADTSTVGLGVRYHRCNIPE